MRSLLVSFCLLFCCTIATAQVDYELEGTYKRYKPLAGGGQVEQTLKLKGTAAGKYTLSAEGDEVQDFSSGDWKGARIWRRREDSLKVVILDPENEHNARYFAIERTGCLTPVYENGDRMRRRSSFAPVKWRRFRL